MKKELGRAPPLIWTKSKRKATFFRETFPNPRPTQVRHRGPGAGRDQAEKKEDDATRPFLWFCLFVCFSLADHKERYATVNPSSYLKFQAKMANMA